MEQVKLEADPDFSLLFKFRNLYRWARWVYLALVILLVGWTLIG